MLLRSFFGLISWRLFGVVLALAQMWLTTRLIAVEEYGRYQLVLSVALVLAAALLSWPNQAMLRFGREDFMANGNFRGVFASRLVLHVLLMALILPLLVMSGQALAGWLDVPQSPLLVLLILVLFLYPITEMVNVAAQVAIRFSGYGLSPAVQRLCQLGVLSGALLGVSLDWRLLLTGNVIGYLLALLVVGAVIPRNAILPLRFRVDNVRRLASYSWIMPLASLSAFGMSQMDIWFLKHFMTFAEVGAYAWVYNISLLATAFLVPLSIVLAPRSIDLHVKNKIEELAQQLRFTHAALVLAAALMPLALGVLVLVVDTAIVGEYSRARTPLVILAAGTLAQLGMALLEPVMFSNKSLVNRTVMLFVFMALTNAVLDATLIPFLGLAGPALATVAAFSLGLIQEWRMLKRLVPDGMPRNLPARFAWIFIPLFLGLLLLDLPPGAILPISLLVSICMLALARRAGWFLDMALLTPRLWPCLHPTLCWLWRVQGSVEGTATTSAS